MTLRVPYPFPLRPDFVAKIELPSDLTEREAERVAEFIRTIGHPNEAKERVG